MKIKICGITTAEDALYSARAGADFIGFLLWPGSKRCVSLDTAREIMAAARAGGAEPVGVFFDEPLDQICRIAEELGLKTVQAHAFLSDHPKGLNFIFAQPSLSASQPECDWLLFDNAKPGSGKTFDWASFTAPRGRKWMLAGGLSPENVGEAIAKLRPTGVDVSSGVASTDARRKDFEKVKQFINNARGAMKGRYGPYGGAYVPELMIEPLLQLQKAWEKYWADAEFKKTFYRCLEEYAGRPTPLTEVVRFSEAIGGPRIFLKREDLLHTGAHKLNNALGQVLLAKLMGKTRIIAETGAGQHGVATATACARLGLECEIYMGSVDMARQQPNVKRMELLGAKVIPVNQGSATLKDAVNEALRDWASSFETTHYCLGSALGPHPFPEMVREFQSIIGQEARRQILERTGRLPDLAIACVGGGSNAIGLFSAFLNDESVQLIGVEGGGRGDGAGEHAARFLSGSPGVLHGSYSYLLQDQDGQVLPTHSVSAGLDYPAVGPQHTALFETKRASYFSVRDQEAVEALILLSRTEGIIPALESSHALAYLKKIASQLPKETIVIVNLSGRGEKDLPQLFEQGLI